MSAFSGGLPDLGDIFGLDRDVERAYRAWQTWHLALRADPEAHADEDVFLLTSHRRVATKSLFDGLAAQADPAGAHEGLRRWVALLLQARNTHDADVTLAREAALREDDGRRPSYREAWRSVVHETARGKAITAFEAAVVRGPAIAAPLRERRARREEVLRRLGLEGESALEPKELAGQRALAEAILAATHDLADAFLREERKNEGAAAPHPVDAIRIALGRAAREGWPARLSPRWLHELFGGWLTGAARFELGPLPAAISGASFVRALETFGQSFRRASFETRSTLPFALRTDPHFVDVYRTGALTASLAASPIFQRRALGLGKDSALLQARILGKTLLFTLRLTAARVLLAGADGAIWDDVTARLFGAPAPRALAGAWPESRVDEGARLVGAGTVLPWTRSLVDEFDEDWFSNPRAFEALRARTLYPARAWTEGETWDPAQTARDIGRHFEELFG